MDDIKIYLITKEIEAEVVTQIIYNWHLLYGEDFPPHFVHTTSKLKGESALLKIWNEL